MAEKPKSRPSFSAVYLLSAWCQKQNEAFGTKASVSPNFKAGMDATITDGSFATILSIGSAGMLTKSIDYDRFLEETSFLRPATADRNS